MFVLEESQLIEDCIKDKQVLQLYKTLKDNESRSSKADLLDSLNKRHFGNVCRLILNLPNDYDATKLSAEERSAKLEELGLDKNDSAALVLVVAATLIQLFIIDNFTGPESANITFENTEIYKQLEDKFDHHSLSLDGCEVYHLIKNPWLLKTVHSCWFLLDNLGVHRRLLELEFLVWKHRYITVYISVLHEPPEKFLKDLRKLQEYIFDHHLINDLKENKTQLVRFDEVELCCELIQTSLLRSGITSSRKIFEYASEFSGITIEHTGVLGKRTRFQQSNLPQLVVKVKSRHDVPADPAQREFKPDLLGLPKEIELDDDTLLPDISFVTDSMGEEQTLNGGKPDLSPAAQLLMLTQLDYILKTEVMEESLKDEWTHAYLRSIIKSSTIWAIKYKALALRSMIEKKQMRKMDRALLQLEELIKEVRKVAQQQDDDDDQDALRLKSFYSILPQSRWQMQRSLGDSSFDLCLYKNALEIYTQIEYWEGMIKCFAALGETSKAEMVIRQELSKHESPYLYCLLGDATDDIQYYEKSWILSNGRFARAKKSVGTYYYVRKDYSKAIDEYELALSASPSNISILSLLAYGCLLLERYERAAECYRNLTYQDDTNFLAWNNLSKAYIKLNQKDRAWRTLREAIKCNYEEPKIWENFMLVSVEIGAFDDVIFSWHRLIDIRGSHRDDQIISALTYSLIKKSYSKTDQEFIKLFNDAIKLVARVSTTASNSSRTWICYFRLLVRQYELLKSVSTEVKDFGEIKAEMPDMDISSRASKIKNCLQRATPTTVIADANWHQSLEKINQILEAHEELVDCYDLALNTFGRRPEIWSQWKSYKLTVNNTLRTLAQKGYDRTLR